MSLGLGLSADSSIYKDFTLTDVGSLSLWLQNGVGVTAGQWDDSSGNNNHATQDTEGNQAVVSGGGLDFEASESDHYDLASTITIAENGGFCMAVVFELESLDGVILGKDADDQLRVVNDTTFRFRANAPTDTTSEIVFEAGTFPTATKMLFLINRSAGASNRFTFFKNGTALTADTDTSTNEAEGENPNGFDLNVLSGKQGSSAFFDGKILELAFWSKELSATEIADVNSYLKDIHGL